VQANCPKCAQKIVIDDARVPERAFSVKCPKCQTSVKFPGKGAGAPAPPAAAPAEAPAAGGGGDEALRAEMMAQIRREMALGETRPDAGRAVVSLGDRALTGTLTLALTRQGYQVDTVDTPEEASRLVEQGVYDLVATTRAAGAGKESLYQRMNRLSPDSRRRVFLLLVGDDFKTGDGTQAWVALADLVVNTRDLATADAVLGKITDERSRLYQVYVEARRRFEASAG
jgi:predicted Zn finger-like uncharacterized protein